MKYTIKVAQRIWVLLIITFPALSQQPDGRSEFQTWDQDSNLHLDRNEFSTGLNAGDDNFYGWDTNGDSLLDESEWNEGFSNDYSNQAYNADYGQWDLDGSSYVDGDEYTDAMFNLWDEDNDDFVDQHEFDTWSFDEGDF